MKRLWNLLVAILAWVGLLVTAVMFTPLVPWWAGKVGGPIEDPTGDVLIVLSGSGLEDGIIGQSSYWRSVYAVRAYRKTPFSKVIVSGGGRFHVSTAMRDFLVSQGVPQDRVVAEDRSTSTRENALYTKEMLAGMAPSGPGHLVLLTSDYHMFRALRAFRKAGLDVAPRSFPDAIKRSSSLVERWPVFFELCEEGVKSAYYWARRWI
jgi:uncharacterized SAM-binding protein YcdF (DUF218 family)